MTIWKSGAILIAAIATGSAALPLLARQKPLPQNQTQFDAQTAQFNAQSGAQWDEWGHAYANREAKLFWFTDLEAAKKQAKTEKKPILSLRMLGNLSDEYSCANSRLFRVLFYADPKISTVLRQKFVLHWKSERPVPVVTIDMGDGRKIKRTLTGNSAHYLLAESGEVLDVLPGMTTPAAFANWLEDGQKLRANWKSAPDPAKFLAHYHDQKLAQVWSGFSYVDARWVKRQIEVTKSLNPLENPDAPREIPIAEMAGRYYVSKIAMEGTVLDAMREFNSQPSALGMANDFNRDYRLNFSNLNPKTEPILDEAAKNRIRALAPVVAQEVEIPLPPKNGLTSYPATQFDQIPIQRVLKDRRPKTKTVSGFEVLIAQLENDIQTDASAGQTRMLAPIHASFAAGKQGDLETLNRKIYDRLFLTPQNDKWLGLSGQNTFVALQNGGLFESEKEN